MKLNPKITGGLAWAGLIVILAVPGADLLTRQPGDAVNRVTTGIDPARTASVTPAAAGGDAVDSYVSSGRKLPSYISDAPAEVAATKPVPTVRLVAPTATPGGSTTATTAPTVRPVTTPGTVAPVEVATVSPATPAIVAPVPYPVSMRPRTPLTAPATTVRAPVVADTTADEPPLIIDEDLVQRREDAVAAVLDETPQRSRARVVTQDQLEEWDSGSLAEYLERRGLMSEADAQAMNRSDGQFDDDGFFLDEGPNNSDGRRVVRRLPPRDSFLFF